MKKIITLLLFAIAASAMMLNAEIVKHVQIDDLYYNLDTDSLTAEVTYDRQYSSYNYGNLSGAIDIPNIVTYNNLIYSVTSIGEHAFYENPYITSISIPEGVVKILYNAFAKCLNLKSVVLPSSLEYIDGAAFHASKRLKNIEIPATIQFVGGNAFQSCTSITSIIFPEGITSIEGSICNYCLNLISAVIPSTIDTIHPYSFYECPKLATIYNYASTPQIIDTLAFGKVNRSACKLYVQEDAIELYRNADVWNEFVILPIPDPPVHCVLNAGSCGAEGNNLLWDLSCDSVLYIRGTGAMADYNGGGAPWDYLDDYDFVYHNQLSLPDGLTYIGNYAFYESSRLKSITIPASVTGIGDNAFYECPILREIYNYATTPQSITKSVFGKLHKKSCALLVPKESVEAYKAADVWKDFAIFAIGEEYEPLPEPCIVASGNCGMYGEHITWELTCDSVLTISGTGEMNDYNGNWGSGGDAPWYYNYLQIKHVIIEEGVTYIGISAFEADTVIETIQLPNTLTAIGDRAFVWCSKLKELDIPASVTSLGNNLFGACMSLKRVTLPPDITTIDEYMFNGCPLKSIVIPDKVTDIKDYAFAWCDSLAEISLPNGLQTLGRSMFVDGHSLTHIEIPEGITRIESETFLACWNLITVELPSNLQYVGGRAFEDCHSLQSITCRALTPPLVGTEEYESYAFNNVDKFNCALYVPAASIELYKQADQWNEFFYIQPIPDDQEDSVQDVTVNYLDRVSSVIDSEVVTLTLPDAPKIEGFTFTRWEIVAGPLSGGINIQAVYTANVPTSAPAEVINPANPAQKLIRNGNVYILTDTKTYTVQGQEVR